MKVNEFFEKIYCINLDERKDRWQRCEEVFDKFKIEVERVPGVPGATGWKIDKYPHPKHAFEGVAGGTQAHLNALKDATDNKLNSILVLEDDIEFIDDFNEYFDKASESIPDDWEMMYLGGMYNYGVRAPELINKHVARIYHMMSTHSYGLRCPLPYAVHDEIMETFPYMTDSMDGYLVRFQKMFKAYAFIEPMAWQRAEFSDIQHATRDYVSLFKRKLI
jgi:GR25 family glycosyltransferase involved in LPS biosynthesis